MDQYKPTKILVEEFKRFLGEEYEVVGFVVGKGRVERFVEKV